MTGLFALIGSAIEAIELGTYNSEARTLGYDIKPLPGPVAFNLNDGSTGCKRLLCTRQATLVIAHAPAEEKVAGIMSPNPYFGGEDCPNGNSRCSVQAWNQTIGRVLDAAEARPVEERRDHWRSFWRGRVTKPDCNKWHTIERLRAAVHAQSRPELHDIRVTEVTGSIGSSCTSDLNRGSDVAEVLQHVSTSRFPDYISFQNYTRWPLLVNLPGSTHSGYSRNLNHLWASGGVVLQWNRHLNSSETSRAFGKRTVPKAPERPLFQECVSLPFSLLPPCSLLTRPHVPV